MWQRPIEFIRTAGYAGGGSVTLAIILFFVTFFEHYEDHNVKAAVFAALGIVFFCGGAFIAWNKERDKFEAEVAKHGNPRFNLGIGQIDVSFDQTRGITLILLSPTLTNHGATSAAMNWQIQYNSPLMRIIVPYTNLPYPVTRWNISGNRSLLLYHDKMLPVVTSVAVESGHTKCGRLLFDLPGDLTQSIRTNPAQLYVGCCDRLNQMTWQGASLDNFTSEFACLPGEEVVRNADIVLLE
jgi:hypothetical protein